MKEFNICIMRPAGYVHSLVFQETADLLMYSLRSLGHQAVVAFNHIDVKKINIIIGIHLFDNRFIEKMPSSTIILNTEPLENIITKWNQSIVMSCKAGLEIWDYNDVNIEYLHANGVKNVKKLSFGYQPELRTIQPSAQRDIDVLFYGSMNERRKSIINALRDQGLNVKTLFGIYGQERDQWISRAKLVLDHNNYDYNIFNVVRVFYLLTNSVAVISEIHDQTRVEPRFKTGVIASSYDHMVDTVMRVVKDDAFLEQQRQTAFDSISSYPQTEFTRALV